MAETAKQAKLRKLLAERQKLDAAIAALEAHSGSGAEATQEEPEALADDPAVDPILYGVQPMQLQEAISDVGERPPDQQLGRLNSFGRCSMTSLPSHCHLDKKDVQLQGLVGQGSFGVVYKALWKGTQVAVKLFLSEDVESEIITLAHITPHPNVLNFLGVGCFFPRKG